MRETMAWGYGRTCRWVRYAIVAGQIASVPLGGMVPELYGNFDLICFASRIYLHEM